MRIRMLAAGLAVTLAASGAWARSNDLNLAGLVLRSDNTTFDRAYHTPFFTKLTSELGIAMAPHFTSPSQTLGSLGFEIGFTTATTNINNGAAYWVNARRTDPADGALALTTMSIRKGLPASFELEGNVSWLANSEMFAMGLAVKWALNEGFYFIPDVAIRGSVNVVVGARDLQLVISGLDFSISKAFPIGGTTTLTPYTGYNLLFINASSRVLDPTPLVPLDIENNFVFSPQTILAHRYFLGLRLKAYFITLVAAVELAFSEAIPWTQTYLGKLSFDF